MPISIFKNKQQEQLDIQEVFNLWNLLRARYYSLETVKFYLNFVHDRDFSIILNSLAGHYAKQANILEKEGEKFKIKVPERPPFDYKTSIQVNIITDSFIFRSVYNGIVAQLFTLMTSVRSSTTNDRIRDIIFKDLKQHIEDFETLYKYGKLKGWQSDPPSYKTAKPVTREPLSVSEAFHIWDNLNHRYQQKQLTQFFVGFTHDLEFKAILTMGLNNLDKEIKTLEEQATKYEISLPERPPASVAVAMDPETMQDVFMFTMIIKGIQDAIDLHIRSVIEVIKNDSLRDLLIKFWLNEFEVYDKLIKYGKLKGWLNTPPAYTEPS